MYAGLAPAVMWKLLTVMMNEEEAQPERIYLSVHVLPLTYSHEFLVVSKTLWTQVAEMTFLHGEDKGKKVWQKPVLPHGEKAFEYCSGRCCQPNCLREWLAQERNSLTIEWVFWLIQSHSVLKKQEEKDWRSSYFFCSSHHSSISTASVSFLPSVFTSLCLWPPAAAVVSYKNGTQSVVNGFTRLHRFSVRCSGVAEEEKDCGLCFLLSLFLSLWSLDSGSIETEARQPPFSFANLPIQQQR